MENMIKVYEEVIYQYFENPDECKILLNEMLDDEAIPYKNNIIMREQFCNRFFGAFDEVYVLEIYVYDSDLNRAREIIEEYEKAEISSEHDELNVTPEDLNYDDNLFE